MTDRRDFLSGIVRASAAAVVSWDPAPEDGPRHITTEALAEDVSGFNLVVWVSKLEQHPDGSFSDRVGMIVDGPYEAAAISRKMLEIAKHGYAIGIHWFPVHKVRLMEVRLYPVKG